MCTKWSLDFREGVALILYVTMNINSTELEDSPTEPIK